MTKPNLYLVGAPKCGTTSMHNYLRTHPSVFLAEPKEPWFFNDDMTARNYTSFEEYESLFEGVDDQDIVGEGSTLYLYSNNAVPNILRYNPAARFIVMLRNPVDMVESWHSQLLYSQTESEERLSVAWKLQEARMRGQHIPSRCRDPQLLQYAHICSLGEQLRRLLRHAGNSRTQIIFLEDLKRHPKRVYNEVLDFMNVADDNRKNFPQYNQRKETRSRWVSKAVKSIGNVAEKLGVPSGTGILAPICRLNTKPRKVGQVTESFRQYLKSYFEEDVEILADLTGRNLEHWLRS